MKRMILWLLVALLLAAPALVLGETDFTWTPYDFTVSLPEGWTADEVADTLALGLPADVQSYAAGETAAGSIVVVRIVDGPELGGEPIDSWSPDNHARVDPARAFGALTFPAVDVTVGGRQGILVLVADTFLVTASAPEADWATAEPVIDTLIASIRAVPVQRSPEARLTQPITWRELSFRTPETWEMWSLGGGAHMYLLTTTLDRMTVAQTFRLGNLMLMVRDYSAIRPFLTPESLTHLRVYYYTPDAFVFDDLTPVDVPGFTAVGVTFTGATGGVIAGHSLLLMTPDSAYLFVGLAGASNWDQHERALFDAILATLAHRG